MARGNRTSDAGQRILDGLDDAIAWVRGDASAAQIVRWQQKSVKRRRKIESGAA